MPAIRALGAELYLVGSGGPHFARAFAEDLELGDVPIFSDEPLASYRLLDFRRDLGGVVSVRALRNVLRALRAGFRQRRTQGDALQLGGVMVVRPGGGIAYQYASREVGDHPPPEEVVAALRGGG